MKLNKEQLAILDHTVHRAPGGFYCGDSSDMQELVTNGLMKFAGFKPGVFDKYFKITSKGRDHLSEMCKLR